MAESTSTRQFVYCHFLSEEEFENHSSTQALAATLVKQARCIPPGSPGTVCDQTGPESGLVSHRPWPLRWSRQRVLPSVRFTNHLRQHRTTLDHQHRPKRTGLGYRRNRRRPLARRSAQDHCSSTERAAPTRTTCLWAMSWAAVRALLFFIYFSVG